MEMTKYSKDGRRTLSRFHAEEMIYEYCTGKLDPIRTNLVKDAIEQEPTLAADVGRIQNALKYCQELSGWPITLKDTEALKGSKTSPIDLIIEKTRIQHWPSGLRLGLESLVVVTAIFSVSVLVPWNKLMDAVQTEKGTFTIAEIRKDFRNQERGSPTEFAAADDKMPIYDDEGFPEEEARRLGRPVADAMQLVPQIIVPPAPIRPEILEQPVKAVPRNVASEKELQVTTEKLASVASVAAGKLSPERPRVEGKTADEGEGTVSQARPATNEELSQTPTGPGASGLKGAIYRGRLDVTNAEAINPKLVQFIDELGGRKAGNVPLGWKSDSGGGYFHFTLPEAKYEDLKNALQGYGQLKLEKHSHGRVMPEGIIRLIVEVKEKKTPEVKEKKASAELTTTTTVKKAKETSAATVKAVPTTDQEKAPAVNDEPREPATDETP